VRLWRKENRIEELVFEHFALVEECLNRFRDCLLAYLEIGDIKEASELAFEVHKIEGKADDARRQVEIELLKGVLLPQSRRQVLRIIEEVDRLANAAEAILDFTLLQCISIPDSLKPFAIEITERSVAMLSDLREAIRLLLESKAGVTVHTTAIEKQESEIDHIERKFIRDLFLMDLPLAEKILVREFVEELVEISDRAEDLSDLIEISLAERRI